MQRHIRLCGVVRKDKSCHRGNNDATVSNNVGAGVGGDVDTKACFAQHERKISAKQFDISTDWHSVRNCDEHVGVGVDASRVLDSCCVGKQRFTVLKYRHIDFDLLLVGSYRERNVYVSIVKRLDQ